jgi:hypothetical protein
MIAESTPFGGIDLNTTDTEAYNESDPWQRWFGKVVDLIETYDIDLWSYINCDWESQPMWHNVGFGDTRLSSNEKVMRMWHDLIINGNGTQKFLMAGTLRECGEQKTIVKKSGFIDIGVGYGLPLACLFAALAVLIKIASSPNRRHRGNASEQIPLVPT